MKTLLSLFIALPLSAQVPTLTVETKDLERTTTQPITADPFHLAEFGSMVTGYVEAVEVEIGDRVKAKQLLARVAVPELAKQLQSEQARARQVASEIAATEATVAAARTEYGRVLKLTASNTVNQKVADEALERLASAQATQAAAEARLKAAEARVAEIETLINYTRLVAPFDGLVVRREIDPGDLVGPAHQKESGGVLFQVARTHPLRVVAHLPERDAVLADPGDPATLTFDAFPGRRFEVTLSRRAGALDPQTQRMRVEFDLPNEDGSLPAGLFGRAEITLAKKPTAIVIPPSAIRQSPQGPIVYLLEEGIVRHRPITLGIDLGTEIEVLSGLVKGDLIIASTIERFADGDRLPAR